MLFEGNKYILLKRITVYRNSTCNAPKKKQFCSFFNTWVLKQKFEANGIHETFPATCARACFAGSTFLRKLVLHLNISVQQAVLLGRVFPCAACAVNGLVLSKVSLCCPWTCLFYSSWYCIWTWSYSSLHVTCGRAAVQKLMLPVDVSVQQQPYSCL
jgi:hypothetical protein